MKPAPLISLLTIVAVTVLMSCNKDTVDNPSQPPGLPYKIKAYITEFSIFPGDTTFLSYDSKGRLNKLVDPLITTTLQYNQNNTVTQDSELKYTQNSIHKTIFLNSNGYIDSFAENYSRITDSANLYSYKYIYTGDRLSTLLAYKFSKVTHSYNPDQTISCTYDAEGNLLTSENVTTSTGEIHNRLTFTYTDKPITATKEAAFIPLYSKKLVASSSSTFTSPSRTEHTTSEYEFDDLGRVGKETVTRSFDSGDPVSIRTKYIY